jgi:hypothetical protein
MSHSTPTQESAGIEPARIDVSADAPIACNPFEIALPEEDASELEWHKATLIEEEDIRERVTIPTAFASRHLWSPLSPSSDPSSSALNVRLADCITFPPIVLAEARRTLFNALAPSTQLSSVPARPTTPKDKASSAPKQGPLPEPIVTLLCPFDNTADIIDALVINIALSQGAEILVLDALMFAQGEGNSLGPG